MNVCVVFVILWSCVARSAFSQTDPNRELLLAAARGDAAAIPVLVARGADPDSALNPGSGEIKPVESDIEFSSALSISTYCGCIDVTRALLAAGAHPTAVDFRYAVQYDQLEIARTLLAAGALRNNSSGQPSVAWVTRRLSSDGAHAIRKAMLQEALTGRFPEEMVGVLLASVGSTAHVRDGDGRLLSLVDDLISHGLEVDGTAEDDDGVWRTAREIATRQGDVLLARHLSARGSKRPEGWTKKQEEEIQLVAAVTAGNDAGVALLLKERVSPDASDMEGSYALATALEHHNVKLANELLAAGASPGRHGPKQASPLNSAARIDHTEMVTALLDRGADPNQLDGTGTFPLQSAAREGAIRTIATLLARGASAGLRDAGGRTALHGLIEPEKTSFGPSPKNRPLNDTHLEAVRLLGAAGLPFSQPDADGNSVLSSNFGYKHANMRLINALLSGGARTSTVDLQKALRFDDAALLRVLLRNRDSGPLSHQLLLEASERLEQVPDLTVALLEYGAELPSDSSDQRSLLFRAVGASSTTPLGLLLARGLPLSSDPENRTLEIALAKGRPHNVTLLAARGTNIHAKDAFGSTAMHRYIASDTPGRTPSRIGAAQRAAITSLIDAGFLLSTPDSIGRTVSALAQRKPDTLANLNQAMAAAGASAQGIHAAVRGDRLNELRRLVVDIKMREAPDMLGRTPLSLALQLGKWPAARILLRAGAVISQVPTQPWLPADTYFAGERAIASAFAVRLLTTPLVDIPRDRSREGLQNARQAYRDGRTLPFEDFTWRLRCMAIRGTCDAPVAGNMKVISDLIESYRLDRGPVTSYGLIQRNLRSIHQWIRLDFGSRGAPLVDIGEMTFFLTGAMTIQACPFSFENPACSPGVRIHNPNTDSELSMLTDTGYEKLPTATLRYWQTGVINGVLAPGETVILDRSAGPIIIEMDEVKARVFALNVEVERIAGEPVEPLPQDPTTAHRMGLYARLARLHQSRKPVPGNNTERAADKTVASTISALSVEAWHANYPTVVLALLRQQADAIAGLDPKVRAVQNAVLAQATYTPGQIDVLVEQINALLSMSGTGDTSILHAIQAELLRMRASAEAAGTAINELRNTLFTDADLNVELYQALNRHDYGRHS